MGNVDRVVVTCNVDRVVVIGNVDRVVVIRQWMHYTQQSVPSMTSQPHRLQHVLGDDGGVRRGCDGAGLGAGQG